MTFKKTLDFDDHKKSLFDPADVETGKSKSIYKLQFLFRNEKHEIRTVEVNKVVSNRDDDKRVIQKDGISTLAHGHYSLCF